MIIGDIDLTCIIEMTSGSYGELATSPELNDRLDSVRQSREYHPLSKATLVHLERAHDVETNHGRDSKIVH